MGLAPQGLALQCIMLDDLAELVMAKGGEVIIVPAERMPTDALPHE